MAGAVNCGKSYQHNYGPDGDPRILVAQGESRALNPELSAEFVARQYECYLAAASAGEDGLRSFALMCSAS